MDALRTWKFKSLRAVCSRCWTCGRCPRVRRSRGSASLELRAASCGNTVRSLFVCHLSFTEISTILVTLRRLRRCIFCLFAALPGGMSEGNLRWGNRRITGSAIVIQFEAWWRVHSEALRVYIRGRVSNPSDTDDILQECAVRGQRAWPPESDKDLRGFAFTIARHTLIDHLRRERKRRRHLALEEVAETLLDRADGAESLAFKDEEVALVRRAAEELNADDRQVLHLRIDLELPYELISSILRTSSGALRKRVGRACRGLRVLCEARGIIEEDPQEEVGRNRQSPAREYRAMGRGHR